jgi:predicted flap endonuclease-1-like 5' DNA nuclease
VESLVKNLEFDKQWLENLECSLVEIKKSQTEHESVHSLVDSNPDFEERLSKLENSEIEIEKNEEKLIQLLRAQLAQMREEFHGLIASVSDGSDKKIGLVDAQIKMIVERLEAMGAHSTVDDTNSNEAIEEKSLDTVVASFERLMSEKEDTIQALHAEVRALSVQKPVPELAGPDNLDAIDGIGKGTRRWLESDLGIRTFRDLALVSEDKLSEIISRLHFKDRVFRDNWIGQARELHHQKYKEWLPENPVRRKNGFF